MADQWQPYGAPGDPFRVPRQTSNRWGQGQFAQTPVGSLGLESAANRGAAFTRYNQIAGIDPMGVEGRNYTRLYPQVSLGYESAVFEDPELTFADYYGMIQPQIRNYIAGMSPEEQGKRGMPRPARTIPRGYA
jgi:hypothetical protein